MQRPLADSPCCPRPQPDPRELQLLALIEQRAYIGLANDRTHVGALLDDPQACFEEGYRPLTAAEARYVRMREDDDLFGGSQARRFPMSVGRSALALVICAVAATPAGVALAANDAVVVAGAVPDAGATTANALALAYAAPAGWPDHCPSFN